MAFKAMRLYEITLGINTKEPSYQDRVLSHVNIYASRNYGI